MRLVLAASFLLAAPALASAPAAKPAAADDSQKVICKRMPVTGSLVQVTRECKTKGDWERAAEGTQKQMRERLELKGLTNGN